MYHDRNDRDRYSDVGEQDNRVYRPQPPLEKSTASGSRIGSPRFHVHHVRTEMHPSIMPCMHKSRDLDLSRPVASQGEGQGTLTGYFITRAHAKWKYMQPHCVKPIRATPTSAHGRLGALYCTGQGDGVAIFVYPAIPIATSRGQNHGPSTTPTGSPSVSSGCIATM